MAMSIRAAYWGENHRFYYAELNAPDNIKEYAIKPVTPLLFKGAGQEWGNDNKIPAFEMTPVQPKTEKARTQRFGFYADRMFVEVEPNKFRSLKPCGTLHSEREMVLDRIYPGLIEKRVQ